MNLTEYHEVKNFTYDEYCNYLQNKYGIGKHNYMTKTWNINKNCSRTKEGLCAHHKYEKCAIMLSVKEYARNNPFEWQLAENIVYCNYLEHLLLHVLICKYPSEEKNKNEAVGIGGVINYLVPELNDFYSGWETKQAWRKYCHDIVKDNKDTYLEILKRFKENYCQNPLFSPICLFTSFNEHFGLWSKNKNQALFKEIEAL